ncbi:hypothetical protein ACOMHN_017775 [Nucella lapillus]
MVVTVFFFLPFLLLLHFPTAQGNKHVVVFLADDLGFREDDSADPEFLTPNIRNLRATGVSMNSSYMAETGQASRAAFFTGFFPIHLGLQHSSLASKDLPLHARILPQDFKLKGYKTHYVGKWHLGSSSLAHLPTYRGFDSFYGMYGGEADYYNHTTKSGIYDMHDDKGSGPTRQFSMDLSAKGKYSTTLFTDKAVDIINNHVTSEDLFLVISYQGVYEPLQAPESYVTRCSSVTGSDKRRQRCASLAAVDDGVGAVMAELERRGMKSKVMTLFTSDNGGPLETEASNWPLRGAKETLWEGGTRVASILHSPTALGEAGYTWDGMMHAVDWYRTLLRAAVGLTDFPKGIDGVDNWYRIRQKKSSARTEFIYGWNDVCGDYAIRYKDFKFIKTSQPSDWYFPPSGQERSAPDEDFSDYLLFNIKNDPLETTALGYVCQRELLEAKVQEWQANIVPPL